MADEVERRRRMEERCRREGARQRRLERERKENDNG